MLLRDTVSGPVSVPVPRRMGRLIDAPVHGQSHVNGHGVGRDPAGLDQIKDDVQVLDHHIPRVGRDALRRVAEKAENFPGFDPVFTAPVQ